MLLYPLIIMILTTLVNYKITKKWLAPGVFFASFWSFFVIVPIIFANEYQINQMGLWFIAIFTMALSAGSVIAYCPPSKQIINHKNLIVNFNYRVLLIIFFLLTLISFFGLYLLFKHATSFYSIGTYNNGWLSIPNFIAVDRYSGMLTYPFIIKYSLYFIYPANLLGGLLIGFKKIRKKHYFLLLMPLIASFILGMIEGARTSILLGAILFLSAWLSSFIFRQNQTNIRVSYTKIIFGSCIALSMFTFLFILIQWLRQGMDNLVAELLIERVRAYFFGYLAGFTIWFDGEIDSGLSAGFITFAGPFNLLGLMDRPLGFYEPVNINNNISTNIFTVFRGLVSDFSIGGSIVIAFLIGFILQSIFQKEQQESLLIMLPISIFYAFTLYSPLISIFHYNSILFSWVILFFILSISKHESLVNYS